MSRSNYYGLVKIGIDKVLKVVFLSQKTEFIKFNNNVINYINIIVKCNVILTISEY